MGEASLDAKMIIASNLTVAAFIRDAAILIKDGKEPSDTKESVTQVFADLLADLEKQSLGMEDRKQVSGTTHIAQG